jgi:PUA domain protein
MKVDKGAIVFLIQGANVMCPGLTSKGAQMTPEVKEGSVVTLIAEGKQNALAVGFMKLSSEKM